MQYFPCQNADFFLLFTIDLFFALYSLQGIALNGECRLLRASDLDRSIALLQAAFLVFGHKVSPAVNIIHWFYMEFQDMRSAIDLINMQQGTVKLLPGYGLKKNYKEK